jgi:hypothetical protein
MRLPLLVVSTLMGCTAATEPEPDPAPEPTPEAPSFCEEHDFVWEQGWDALGPYGTRRHDVAEGFWLPVRGDWEPEDRWDWDRTWTGCESVVFLPDTLRRSQTDATSLWESDLGTLLERSPRNVHYVFVSRRSSASAGPSLDAMEERIASVLDDIEADDPEAASWWGARLHLVSERAADLGGWVEDTLSGIGQDGFAIDRFQRIRGIGGFADVNRYTGSQEGWPWNDNLAYAAHEVRYFNMEAARHVRLAAVPATVVPLWSGDLLGGAIDATWELPDAATMATFDTLEIEVEARCPDPERPEFGNCGAWDYLAWLYVQAEDQSWIEVGRFITTYHREAHWVVDVSPMLVHLLSGGPRVFRWDGGGQGTQTWVSLRLSDQGKGARPRQAWPLFDGGMSGQTREIPVPASTTRFELFSWLTGHGQDGDDGCAEFCNHRHELTVNGTSYLREHPTVGDNEGCITQIEEQMTPNQWGTWWFGRGGWCPGQQVPPWRVDVTADVTPGGTATVGYNRLLLPSGGNDGGGTVRFNSWVVAWE